MYAHSIYSTAQHVDVSRGGTNLHSRRKLQMQAKDAGRTEAHCGGNPANEACYFNRRRSAGSRWMRLHPANTLTGVGGEVGA
jgi:hypothetical protein